MKEHKEQNRIYARQQLKKRGFVWESFNDDLHWKLKKVDFWPTSNKWYCSETGVTGNGVKSLIAHLERPRENNGVNILSPEEIFEVAKHSTDKSLEGICTEIHNAIYK